MLFIFLFILYTFVKKESFAEWWYYNAVWKGTNLCSRNSFKQEISKTKMTFNRLDWIWKMRGKAEDLHSTMFSIISTSSCLLIPKVF